MRLKIPVKLYKNGFIRLPSALVKYTELKHYAETGEPIIIEINLNEKEENKQSSNEIELYTTIHKQKGSPNFYRYIITIPTTIAKMYELDKYVNTTVKVKITLGGDENEQ